MKKKPLPSIQAGSALILTMFVLMILSIFGTIALTATNSELSIVRKELNSQKAFFIAESGLEDAKMYTLENKRSLGFILEYDESLTQGNLEIENNNLGGGSYEVHFQYEDEDNEYFYIISSGSYNNFTRQVKLRVKKDYSEAEIKSDAAFAVHTPNPSMKMQGNPFISGKEWELPTTFECSGGGCSGQEMLGGIEMPSIYSEDEFVSIIYQDKHMDPNFDESTVGQSQDNSNETWIKLAEERLIPKADRMIDSSSSVSGDDIWGTRENPEITVVDGRKLAGTINGAGVMILRNGADVTGNFHFEGVVIYLVEEGDEVEMFSAGTPNVFGSVVVAGTGAPSEIHFEDEIEFMGTAKVKFNSEALRFARDAIGAKLEIVAWEY